MTSSSSLWWLRCGVTHIHTQTHVNQKKPPCIWSSLIIIFFYSRAIDRFPVAKIRRRQSILFFPYYSFFFFYKHTPTYVDVVFRWPHAYTERQTHKFAVAHLFFCCYLEQCLFRFISREGVSVSEREWTRENEWMREYCAISWGRKSRQKWCTRLAPRD